MSRAESKPPEIQLRKALPVVHIGKGLISSEELIEALERQWVWPVLSLNKGHSCCSSFSPFSIKSTQSLNL